MYIMWPALGKNAHNNKNMYGLYMYTDINYMFVSPGLRKVTDTKCIIHTLIRKQCLLFFTAWYLQVSHVEIPRKFITVLLMAQLFFNVVSIFVNSLLTSFNKSMYFLFT